MRTYDRLVEVFDRVAAIHGAESILHWDMQTNMPDGGAEIRGRHLATLEAVANEMIVAGQVADWIDESAVDGSLAPWEAANVREMRRRREHIVAVDPKLKHALTIEGTRCTNIWRKARPDNDFKTFAPAQQRVFDLVREAAQQKASALGCSPYDALIDQFEPSMTTATIDDAFTPLRAAIPGLIDAAIERQSGQANSVGTGPFSIEAQKQLGMDVMKAIGFDFEHGRLDVSAHPFCGGLPADVRLTTRYRTDEWFSSLMGIVHETGHALYEQGLPADWTEQPVGHARSMSVHESQSLMWEMQVARSPEFLAWLAPQAAATFGQPADVYTPELLARAATRVERGLIRVDADECTYPAHVLLRFGLEKDIVAGTLNASDLPDAWAAGMKELVGVEPPDNRHGCMQDIHWTDGAIGYFPSYTLGAMTAAQLFEAFESRTGRSRADFADGDFVSLLTWLRDEVHSRASLLSTTELVTAATGKPLDADAFLRHLRRRYLGAA
jgi:carboxypeptidase Taq